MKLRFETDLQIKNLKPKAVQYEVYDEKPTGLAVRVSPRGAKSFTKVYRVDGKKVRTNLGRYPALSLSVARIKACEVDSKLASGIRPSGHVPEKSTPFPFAVIAAEYIEKYAKVNTKRWRETERILLKQVMPILGCFNIQDIDKRAINKVTDTITTNNGRIAANLAFAYIRHMFNWCITRDYLSTSPCNGLKRPHKARERERVLDEADIAKVLDAADRLGYPFGPVMKLLLLTGQRRSEVAGMRWADLSLDKAVWTQPAYSPDQPSNKSERTHDVPLSRQCLDVLRNLPRLDANFVFPARGREGRAVSGFSKWKRKLDSLSGVQGWVLHDLRRTAATRMAARGVPIHVVELTLNHSSTKLTGVARVYNRHAYLEERRQALQDWADHLDELRPMHPLPADSRGLSAR